MFILLAASSVRNRRGFLSFRTTRRSRLARMTVSRRTISQAVAFFVARSSGPVVSVSTSTDYLDCDMAKTQTFQDKNKKKASEFISVKVVITDRTERGTYKFSERFIKVKDMAEVDKAIKG
jgi:hypothetical protein